MTSLSEAIQMTKDFFTPGSRVKLREDDVIRHFGIMFSPKNLDDLTWPKFKTFFFVKYNHHWTNLIRSMIYFDESVDELIPSLRVLLDESVDITERLKLTIPKGAKYKARGSGSGIYSPILMFVYPEKYAVFNDEVAKALTKLREEGILDLGYPTVRKYHFVKIYKRFNEFAVNLAKDNGLTLWELDWMWTFYTDESFVPQLLEDDEPFFNDLPDDDKSDIEADINDRKKRWDALRIEQSGEIPFDELSKANLRVGQRGIIANKLPDSDKRITLSILTTGTSYDDVMAEDSLTYKYPRTGQPRQDENEIESMKSAMHNKVPIFVIIGNKRDGKTRKLKLGLVRDYDTEEETFLVDLFDHWPESDDLTYETQEEQEENFNPYDKSTKKIKVETTARPGQTRFKFNVLKRYGSVCAVCGVKLKPILEAAHIVPKSKNGSDKSPNGLIMCANHHRMFDNHLFTIDPKLQLMFRDGYDGKNLMITVKDLSHLPKKPHVDALKIRYELFEEHT